MEIILIKDVENLGYANDIVNVRPGYANNYLIPQGFAKAATASAKKVLAENLKQRAHKDAKILADAQALAEKLANLPLTFTVKAEERASCRKSCAVFSRTVRCLACVCWMSSLPEILHWMSCAAG